MIQKSTLLFIIGGLIFVVGLFLFISISEDSEDLIGGIEIITLKPKTTESIAFALNKEHDVILSSVHIIMRTEPTDMPISVTMHGKIGTDSITMEKEFLERFREEVTLDKKDTALLFQLKNQGEEDVTVYVTLLDGDGKPEEIAMFGEILFFSKILLVLSVLIVGIGFVLFIKNKK